MKHTDFTIPTYQDNGTCDYHQDMTILLSSVDTSLKNLIGLAKWAIGLWFPVFVAASIFGLNLNSRVTEIEKQQAP